MSRDRLPTQDELKAMLSYDESTGRLTWRNRPVETFPCGKQSEALRWNKRHAGKPAFNGKNSGGYLIGLLWRRTMSAHRVIWCLVHGEWPEEVDHINGKPDDNRIANLRAVTKAENAKNKKRSGANTSGVTGVSWFTRDRRWVAFIKVNRKQTCLGYFEKFEDAVDARKAAETHLDFHANHGRAA